MKTTLQIFEQIAAAFSSDGKGTLFFENKLITPQPFGNDDNETKIKAAIKNIIYHNFYCKDDDGENEKSSEPNKLSDDGLYA